jgi:hypothetical protein
MSSDNADGNTVVAEPTPQRPSTVNPNASRAQIRVSSEGISYVDRTSAHLYKPIKRVDAAAQAAATDADAKRKSPRKKVTGCRPGLAGTTMVEKPAVLPLLPPKKLTAEQQELQIQSVYTRSMTQERRCADTLSEKYIAATDLPKVQRSQEDIAEASFRLSVLESQQRRSRKSALEHKYLKRPKCLQTNAEKTQVSVNRLYTESLVKQNELTQLLAERYPPSLVSPPRMTRAATASSSARLTRRGQ